VDKRADIWAFGAVLFEMLTGARAFGGDDVAETMGAVIHKEPDWSALSSATPIGLRRLLGRCLKKEVRARLRDIGEARVQVEELLGRAPEETATAASGAAARLTTAPATASSSRGRLPWIAAMVVMAALAAALAVPALRHLRETPPPEMRVEIATPATDAPLQFALSPDGRSLVFVASGDGPSRLWLRPLDRAEARPLAGTEGAKAPFWSPARGSPCLERERWPIAPAVGHRDV